VGSITYLPDLIHAVDQAGGMTFSYDLAGNLEDDDVNTYACTARGRLESVTDGGGATLVENGYDFRGRRVERVDDAGDAVFFLPEMDAELRLPAGGSETLVKHVSVDGIPVARVTDTFDAATVADAVELLATDHLGSPTLVLDTSGGVLERWASHPFGEENTTPLDDAGVGADYLAPDDGATRLHRRFQGRELDPSSGLYDFGARVYRPDLGRFLTPDDVVPDPLASQSFNRYAFVRNNPLRYTDPTGHEEVAATTPTATVTWEGVVSVTADEEGVSMDLDTEGLPSPVRFTSANGGTAEADLGPLTFEVEGFLPDNPAATYFADATATGLTIHGGGALTVQAAPVLGGVAGGGGIITGSGVSATGVTAGLTYYGGQAMVAGGQLTLVAGSGLLGAAIGHEIESKTYEATGFHVCDAFVDDNAEYQPDVVRDTFSWENMAATVAVGFGVPEQHEAERYLRSVYE